MARLGRRRIPIWLLLAVSAFAQTAYRARLTPVAMDAAMKVNIAGSGSASAVLTGNQFSVNGKFEGLLSPATTAQIRRGSLTGVSGPAILDLTVSHAASGSVNGTFELNADQIASLRKGRLYIQIASQRAPDGNLWGWLLP